MAAIGGKGSRGVSLARGSLILIIVGVLLFGGGAGFAIGYKVEQGRTKSTVKAAKAKPNAKTKTAAKGAQLRLQKERVCLAAQGIHWPVIVGKFATQLRKPPAGVSVAKYQKALIACYAAAASSGSRSPPTTTGA
jgi:hypothetical protein